MCRFVLQPGALPEEARLSGQLGAMRALCADLEAAGAMHAASDLSDVLLRADGRSFRHAHTLLDCARCMVL